MDKKKWLKWALVGAGAGAAGYGAFWAVRNPMEVARRFASARLASQGAVEQRIGYADGSVRYFRLGDTGPALVIVHGLGDLPASWYRVTASLARDFRIVLFEQPQHGESTAVGGYTIAKAVRALDAVVAHAFPDERAVIVGSSLGGWVSCRFAAEHPERTEQLVLLNSGGMEFDIDLSLLLPRSPDEARRAMRAIVGPKADTYPRFIHDAFARQIWSSETPEILERLRDEPPLTESLERIRVPTHVIAGRLDRLIPPEQGLEIAEAVDGATFELVDGLAHAPHVATAPRLIDVLRRALGS